MGEEILGIKADWVYGEMIGTVIEAAVMWKPGNPKSLIMTNLWDDEQGTEDLIGFVEVEIAKAQSGFFRKNKFSKDDIFKIIKAARKKQIDSYTNTAKSIENLNITDINARNVKTA